MKENCSIVVAISKEGREVRKKLEEERKLKDTLAKVNREKEKESKQPQQGNSLLPNAGSLVQGPPHIKPTNGRDARQKPAPETCIARYIRD